MPLVVPSIVRCAAKGRIIDDQWACVTDIYVEQGTEPGGPNRVNQIRQATDRLWDAWAYVFVELSSQCTLERIDWVDLDLADGLVGTKVGTNTNPEALQGQSSGTPAPSNIAGLVIKEESGGRRGQRQGRMFLPGLRQTSLVGNNIVASDKTAIQDRLDSFLAEVNQNEDGTLSELRTVHVPRVGAPFSSSVSQLTLRSRVSHQDRRIDSR